MNKKAKVILIAAILIFTAALSIISSNPVVYCDTDIPDSYLEAVESQVRGVYSKKMPLVPLYVSVHSFSGEKVLYTIHYFPFGTVEMSYQEGDGYNIEKPLTRLG